MAQQIKVNSSTGNIQIQISRGAIGPSTTANVANTALNLNAASTANVVIGGGVNGYVLSTDGLGVTSWVAQTGGGGSAPGGANTQIQYNDAGTLEGDATFTFNNTTDVVSASHFSGEAGNLSNIQGANVSGAVANATHATISDSANLVAVANVAGIGNIATVNLDGNAANFLDGTGSFGPAGGGGGTPGGSNTQVQYNDNGAFAGEAVFTYDDVTNTLTAENIVATGEFFGDLDGAVSANVYNNTGVTLNKGDAVYLTGGNNGDNPHVALADADDATKMPALGVVKENIATASVGQVVTSGVMNDSSHGYTLGADLYVSTTPGQLTTTQPTGEANLIQKIGKVVNANQIIVQGAFRTNATPNLDDGNIFIGNATNESTTAVLNTSIVPENTNLYYTDGRSRAALSTTTTAAASGGALAYDNGTGVFTFTPADISSGANANFANYAGNVTVSNQPNITQTGNLLTFTTNDGVANSTTHQIDPALLTIPVNYSDTEAQEVITMWGDDITPNYYGGDGTTTFLMNDINNIQGWSPIVTDYAANDGAGGYARTVRQQVGVDFIGSPPGVGNNFAVGRVEYTFAGQQSEMNSGNEDTLGSVKLSQNGLRIATGTKTANSVNNGVWDLFYYGSNVANEAQGDAIGIRRRRGNGASRLNIAASDYLGNIQWQGLYSTGSGQGPGAKLAPRVSSTFSGSGSVPVGVELYTSDNTGTEHLTEFKADGQTEFPGNLTLNNAGIFTGDGGGLSNVSAGPLGNLSSLTVNDGVANTATHQIDPTLITMPVNYSDTKAQEVITLFGDDNSPNYFGGQGTTTFLMNDINTGTPGFSPVITDYAASNGASGYSQAVRIETGMDFVGVPPSGTNAYAPGRVQYSFAGAQSDLNNADTLGSVKLNQTGVTIQPNTQASTSGIINVFHYGTDPGDPTDANGLDFQRRRGNNASRADIAAGDYLGNIRWSGRKASGFQGNKARMGGRVSTTWNGTDNNIPTELFFRTQDNVGASYDVEFKSDGQATFPGNLTLNG